MRSFFALAALVLLAGCASMDPVPYAPDPAVVRAIPPAKAREAVKRQLERAHTRLQGQGAIRAVEIDDDGIRFEHDGGSGFHRLAGLDPHLYTMWGEYAVRLDGPYAGSVNMEGEGYRASGCVWFANRRDAELLIDALVALKGASR